MQYKLPGEASMVQVNKNFAVIWKWSTKQKGGAHPLINTRWNEFADGHAEQTMDLISEIIAENNKLYCTTKKKHNKKTEGTMWR